MYSCETVMHQQSYTENFACSYKGTSIQTHIKYTCLSLNKKYQLIDMSKKGHSVKQLQNLFKCGKKSSNVYDTLKNQNKIKQEWLKGKFVLVYF